MSDITNFYEVKKLKKFIKKTKNPTEHITGIGYGSRSLIVSGSGGGKTNCFVNFILKSPDTYAHLFIVSKSIEEPLYEFLKDELKEQITFWTLEELPSLNELTKDRGPKEQYLIVFDDLVNDVANDKRIMNYFIAGRKCGLTMFFLSQSYYKVPKIIRQNLTHLILLKLSNSRDLNLVLSDYTLGITKEQLVELYKDATGTKLCPFIIDILVTDPQRKFSKGFVNFYQIEEAS